MIVLDNIFRKIFKKFIRSNLRTLNYRAYLKGNVLIDKNQFVFKNSVDRLHDFDIDIESYQLQLTQELIKRKELTSENKVIIVCWKATMFKYNQDNFKTQFVYFIYGQKGFRTIDWTVHNAE